LLIVMQQINAAKAKAAQPAANAVVEPVKADFVIPGDGVESDATETDAINAAVNAEDEVVQAAMNAEDANNDADAAKAAEALAAAIVDGAADPINEPGAGAAILNEPNGGANAAVDPASVNPADYEDFLGYLHVR